MEGICDNCDRKATKAYDCVYGLESCHTSGKDLDLCLCNECDKKALTPVAGTCLIRRK